MADELYSFIVSVFRDFTPNDDDPPDRRYQAYIDHLRGKGGMPVDLPTTSGKVDFRPKSSTGLLSVLPLRTLLSAIFILVAIGVTAIPQLFPSEEDRQFDQLLEKGVEVQGRITNTEQRGNTHFVTVLYFVEGEGDYEVVFDIPSSDYNEAGLAGDTTMTVRYMPDNPADVGWASDFAALEREGDNAMLSVIVGGVIVGGILLAALWRMRGSRGGKGSSVEAQRVSVLQLPHPSLVTVYAVVVMGQQMAGSFEQKVYLSFLKRAPKAVPEVGGTAVI